MLNQDDDNEKIDLIKQVKDLKDAEKIQVKYSRIFKARESKNLTIKSWNSLDYIAAVDISYYSEERVEYGIACVVLWDFKKNKMGETKFSKDQITFPYIPGYLGFREIPLIIKCLKKLTLEPDIIMCDGHGIIHPRRFGEATHLGFALNLPTIGIAKNPFVGVSNWKNLEKKRGNKVTIYESKDFLGYAICLTNDFKPVFISTGYEIDIDLCIKIALYLSKNHRQPEPLYLADRFSREERSKNKT